MAENLRDVITEAVADIAAHGFDSTERVAMWMLRIRAAAEASLMPQHELAQMLRKTFGRIYDRFVRLGVTIERQGPSRFTLERVQPQLRAELDRRIMASANLIKLNRQKAIEETLQRFSGWATSIPPGGSKTINRAQAKATARKSMAQLSFQDRRVLIDQGHKFTAGLSETLAVNGGALAGIWHSRWRQAGYNYRTDHRERDEQVYTVRGNWAITQGLMKVGAAGYTDEITRPAEEVFCRCSYQYLFDLRDLPDVMLTVKGRTELVKFRVVA